MTLSKDMQFHLLAVRAGVCLKRMAMCSDVIAAPKSAKQLAAAWDVATAAMTEFRDAIAEAEALGIESEGLEELKDWGKRGRLQSVDDAALARIGVRVSGYGGIAWNETYS